MQKWKYVLQRMFKYEGELGDETMKNVSDYGLIHDKMVKELRKVFDIGKFMKLSSSTFN